MFFQLALHDEEKQWVDKIALSIFFTSDTNPLIDPTMEGASSVQTPTHYFMLMHFHPSIS